MSQQNLINLESLIDLCRKLISAEDDYYIYNTTLLSIIGKLLLSRATILEISNGEAKVLITKGQSFDSYPQSVIDELDSLQIDEFISLDSSLLSYYHYALALNLLDKKIVLLFGTKLNGLELNTEEIKYAGLVGQIANIALNNILNKNNLIQEKKQLDEQNFKLVNLLETTKELTTFKSKEEIVKLFSLTLMGQTLITKFKLLYETDNRIESLIDRIEKYNNISNEELFYSFNDFEKDNVCAFNLKFRDSKKGLLLINCQTGEISNNKKLFIELLGNIIVSALENDRLIKEEIAKKTIENELNLALEIQRGLMPTKFPIYERFTVYGKSMPSRYVAGDYFDIISIDAHKLALVIADISGKGMPASLLMANFQAALRTLVRLNLPLIDIVTRLNNLVFENTTPDKFVTFFIATFDTITHQLEYINAGHNRPLIINNNVIKEELHLGGPILGVFEDYSDYKIGKVQVNEEDVVLFYTDGATDVKSDDNVELGQDGFYEVVQNIGEKEAEHIIHHLFDHFEEFGDSSNLFDDITLMCLKIKKAN